MGVAGLWKILEGVSRPVKLETLAKKRLAIDASIWIYQFLKAVRDKEGNALRNSHVVGFFRRICKLLFFGIKPIFVFDGGAPILKRRTIAGRKQRVAGRREDALHTAGQILTKQMQRRAALDAEAQKNNEIGVYGDAIPDNAVYYGEIRSHRPSKSTTANATEEQPDSAPKQKFRKTDQYHLPELNISLDQIGPNDPRVMSREELQLYAENFNGEQDLNIYDLSKIDFDSEFFRSLPAADRYSILNTARLRSRLRMGLSKEQLDGMFPNRLEFSKFQIERVKERNELTQRLMHLNGINESSASRIAAEKGREYVLVKNDGVDGGWALGIVTGAKDKPVVLDEDIHLTGSDDDGDFQEIPLDIDKLPEELGGKQNEARRQAFYNSRKADGIERKTNQQGDSPIFDGETYLPLQSDGKLVSDKVSKSLKSHNAAHIGKNVHHNDEDEDLDYAIAMSLERSSDHGNESEDSKKIEHESAFVIEGEGGRLEEQNSPPKPLADETEVQDIDFDKLLFPSLPSNDNAKISHQKQRSLSDEKDRKSKTTKRPAQVAPPWFGSEAFKTKSSMKSARESDSTEITLPEELKVQRSPNFVTQSDGESKNERMTPEKHTKSSAISALDIKVDIDQDDVDVLDRVDLPGDQGLDEGIQELSAADINVKIKNEVGEVEVGANNTESTIDNLHERLNTTEDQEVDSEFSQPKAAIETSQAADWEPIERYPPPLSKESTMNVDLDPLEEEEEALMQQIAAEADEHDRFAAEINQGIQSNLQNQEDYERELRSLRSQQKKDRRDVDEVTQVMIKECQELLSLFGLPYITAPMEAEAQCAELVRLGLVDGIVTDDSDIFLFGGTRVYKNLFNQAKVVECYLASDLEREFDVDRMRLIRLAYLLGSDYTEGLPHVGPVLALELLSEFNSLNGLQEFKDWWVEVQSGKKISNEDLSPFKKKFVILYLK